MAVSSLLACPVAFSSMCEFSTAIPAMVPSSSRVGSSRSVKLLAWRRPRHTAPSTPCLPRIGIRASATALPSGGSRPLNSPSAWVADFRITVCPCTTLVRALLPIGTGTAEPSVMV